MDLERFENSINKKFENFEPAIDDMKIWEKIENDLPSKEKKKPYWMLGFFLLPIACLFYFSGNNGSTTTDLNNANSVDESTEASLTKADQGEVFESKLSSQSQSGNKSNIEKSESNTTVATVLSSSTFAQAGKNEQKINETEIGVEAVIEIEDFPAKFIPVKITNDQVDETSVKETKVEISEVVPSVVETPESKVINVTVDKVVELVKIKAIPFNQAKSAIDENEEMSSGNSKTSRTPLREVLVVDEVKEAVAREETIDVKKVSEEKISEEIITEEKATNDLLNSSEQLDEPTHGNNDMPIVAKENEGLMAEETEAKSINDVSTKKRNLVFTTGVLLSSRMYEAATNDEQGLAIAEKETAESQLETIQFDFQYKHRFTPKIALGVGLRYWRLSEKSTYLSERDFEDSIQVVTGVIHHVDGTTSESFSTVPISFHEEIENTRYQKHNSWSIPVMLFYTLNHSEKLRTEIGVGYEYSFNGRHIGYELGPDKTEYFVTQDVDANYKNSGGNYFLANFNIEYNINNSFGISAGLEGKYGLNGFNTESASYRKNYHFLGLYAGLNYTF